ncbi:hypothetical protein QUB10_02790, partial [Microcoleus sp. B5-D4]|uniref:hypothetical protein n=1 Tax=unclassified Microcoleus TaxID=2642155 RepID=UPI002FD5D5A9
LIIISDDSLLLPQSAYVPVGGAECGFKARKASKDLSTFKNWEKRQKAPFFRELSNFRYCSKQQSYCAFSHYF